MEIALLLIVPLAILFASVWQDRVSIEKRFYVYRTRDGEREYVGPILPGVFFTWTCDKRRAFLFIKTEFQQISRMPDTSGVTLQIETSE
jgi:hypothetical protein